VALAARQVARPLSGAVPSRVRSIGEHDAHYGVRSKSAGQVPYVEAMYRHPRQASRPGR
jgi:hypothetical protein